jgi:hypothetical protein
MPIKLAQPATSSNGSGLRAEMLLTRSLCYDKSVFSSVIFNPMILDPHTMMRDKNTGSMMQPANSPMTPKNKATTGGTVGS